MLRRIAVVCFVLGFVLHGRAQEQEVYINGSDTLHYTYTPLPEEEEPQAEKRPPFLRRVVKYFEGSTTDRTFEKKIDFTFAGGPSYSKNTSLGIGLLAALADGVHERHDRRLDLIAKRIEALGGKATLVLVEPNVVWVALGVHELGLMLKLGDDSIHIGLKARPVIGRLGLVPHGVGLAGEPGPGLGLLGRNNACLALVAAEHANLVEQLRVVYVSACNRLAR